jgi:hypothetical protein
VYPANASLKAPEQTAAGESLKYAPADASRRQRAGMVMEGEAFDLPRCQEAHALNLLQHVEFAL